MKIFKLGSSNGHSPVLNLSKSGGDHGSAGEPDDRSDVHSQEPSIRDEDENLSDANISDVEDNNEKDEGIYFTWLLPNNA